MSYPLKKLWEIAFIKSWKRLPKWQKVLDEDTGFPYIRVSDFNDEGSIDIKNLKYISEVNHNNISQYVITDQDLYISIAWTIGKTWIIPENLNGANLTENAVRLVYKDISQIFNRYIYYFTTSKSFIEQAGLATRVVAMPKLAISRLKEITVMVPPLQTQKAIVKKLDTAFEKIDASIELACKNLENVEELGKSLLNECSQYEKVKVWDIVKELSAWWDLPKDKSFSKYKTEEYQIPIYANAVKKDWLYWYTHTAKIFEPAITVSARWTIWFTKLRTEPFYPIVRLLVLIPKPEKATLQYLEYIINTINLKQFWSSIPQLSVPQLKNFEIPLPPLEKQKEIVEHLDRVFEKNKKLKEMYEEKLSSLQEMKQSLLREAFEGRLVSDNL